MNKKEILKMLERLKEDVPYLKDFKMKKPSCSFYREYDWGRQWINFNDYYHSIDKQRNALDVEFRPTYGIDFSVLDTWLRPIYKKFEAIGGMETVVYPSASLFVKESLLQNDLGSFTFKFLEDGTDFEKDYQYMKNTIAEHATYIFENYSSIEAYYHFFVETYLNKQWCLMKSDAPEIFHMLAAAKIYKPSQYEQIKDRILDIWDKSWMKTLDLMSCYDLFVVYREDILACLEAADLSVDAQVVSRSETWNHPSLGDYLKRNLFKGEPRSYYTISTT
nr:hypothetical protein [Bacteroidales bacterium]